MLRFLKKYFYLLIIPSCLIIGIVRRSQLDNSERLKFGHVHSSGSHTVIAFISIGVYLTAVSMIGKQLYQGSYSKGVKVKVSMFIGIVSICVLYICASLIR